MLEYAPSALRAIGSVVYSTGFHTSEDNIWIPLGTVGKITKQRPCFIEFPQCINPVAVLRSDVANTERSANIVGTSNRKNARWNV